MPRPLWLLLLANTCTDSSVQSAPTGVESIALTDSNVDAILDGHRIVVMAGCVSDTGCDTLETELRRAAKILGRVAQDISSMSLGSVALHRTAETAAIMQRYGFAETSSEEDNSIDPRCETKVIVDGLHTDFGLTDDGLPPLTSNLARGLVTAIMREIVPGAKALQENADLVTELTAKNFDEVLSQTKNDGQSLLINFYQPPVCLHWPGEYASAARIQHDTSDQPVLFAKLNVGFEIELAERLGVDQSVHDFWHLYRSGEKVAEHTGERSEGAILRFLADNEKQQRSKPPFRSPDL